jgi:4-amino-4-deoxychorismate lyase
VILVNGQVSEHISVADRGLAYGDGVFETIAVVDGKARHWHRHAARLRSGCERLGIALPDEAQMKAEIGPLLRHGKNAVLKIMITRGAGGRGYRPDPSAIPTRIAALHDWPEFPPDWLTDGIDMWVCRTRLGHNPALAGIKHLNRLEQVSASREWPDDHYAEGLMLDEAGLVIEGTRSNVFVMSAGRVLTPDLRQCGVAGVMRAIVCDAFPQLGTAVEQRPLSLDEVLAADELFVCNSIIGIWPVRRLLHKHIKEYGLGPLSLKLQNFLRGRGDIS